MYLCTQNVQQKNTFMKRIIPIFLMIAAMSAYGQKQEPAKEDHIIDGLTSVAAITGETKTVEEQQDTTTVSEPKKEVPLWKKKLY